MKDSLAKLWKALGLSRAAQLRIMRVLHDQFLVAVVGIIFNEKNEVLLFKHKYRKIPWALPGGYIKSEEHPKEALEREIKEESGLTVSVDERLKIRTDRQTARLEIIYMGTFIGGDFKPSDEVEGVGFFDFDKIPDILKDQLVFIDKALRTRSTKK